MIRTLAGMVRLVSEGQFWKLLPMYSSPSFSVTLVSPSIQQMAPF